MHNYAILLCLGYVGATLLVAQTASEVEITSEPHHHLTFENPYVRVFNVEVDPNQQTEMHWHRHDYVAITIGDAEISNTVKDKPPVTVKFQDGDTRFSGAGFAHFIRDTGSQPFRNVTIEILQDQALRNSTAHWDEDRGLEVLPHGTKQILFVKDRIRVTEFELQPGGVAPTQHHAGPQLLVAVSDLDLRNDLGHQAAHPGPRSADAAPPVQSGDSTLKLKSGDHIWFPGNYSQTITNTGSDPARFVTLEFPE